MKRSAQFLAIIGIAILITCAVVRAAEKPLQLSIAFEAMKTDVIDGKTITLPISLPP